MISKIGNSKTAPIDSDGERPVCNVCDASFYEKLMLTQMAFS